MKLAAAILAASALLAAAGLVPLEWDAYDPPEIVTTWRIYKLSTDGTRTQILSVSGGSLMADVELPAGEHTLTHTAVTPQGLESPASEPLFVTVLPPPPKLRIALQVSDDLTNWRTVATHEPDAPRTFARAVIIQP